MLRLSIAFIFVLLSSGHIFGQVLSEDTLKGFSHVMVGVKYDKDESLRIKPTENELKVEIELELRKLGIPVVDPRKLTEAQTKEGLLFFVSVIAEPIDEAKYSYAVYSSSSQLVTLRRKPNSIAAASTWQGGLTVGHTFKFDERPIKEIVNSMTRKFANAWLSANPKQ